MKVPEEIRRVERPANTVVIDRGPKYGDYRYIVQYRNKSEGSQKKRNLLLGYIINMKYVPFVPIEFSFSFGGGAFAHTVSKDILEDLCAAFGDEDGRFLYCLALVRAVKPALMQDRIAVFYINSYAGKVFPGFDLSEAGILQRMACIKKRPVSCYHRLRLERTGSACGKFASGTIAAGYGTMGYTYVPDTWDLLSMACTDDASACGRNLSADIALAMLLSFPAAKLPAKMKDAGLFLDELSFSIVLRMMKRAWDLGVLETVSYFEMIDLLNACCKDYKAEPETMLKSQNWSWLPTEGVEIINSLGFMDEPRPIQNRRRVPWRNKKETQ